MSTQQGIGADFIADIADELQRAQAKWPAMNSAHEAYAVILEEVEEFWAEVRKKQTDYDIRAMYDELVQIAAMAARAADDVIFPLASGSAALDDHGTPAEGHKGAPA